MATCDELQARLAEAEEALHNALTGGKIAEVDDGAKRLRYANMSIADLERYVERLANQVAACTGVRRRARRVFGVIPVDSNHRGRRGGLR